MKNNKGFTLIELLAVIIILGTIIAIAVPSLSKISKTGDDNKKSILSKKIEQASKLFAAKYYADKISSGTVTFTLSDLEKDGLLSLNDDQCVGKRSNNITVSSGVYDYTQIKDCNCHKPQDLNCN